MENSLESQAETTQMPIRKNQNDLTAYLDALPPEQQEKYAATALETVRSEVAKEFASDPDAPPFTTLSADELLFTDFPEPNWIIPGLLREGLTMFAGASKVGKSFLALQIAKAVAVGGEVFGESVAKGSVLYLALEDDNNRLKQRMQSQQWPKGTDVSFKAMGSFHEEIGDLAKGGAEKIIRFTRNNGCSLIVIDTLSRAIIGDQDCVDRMTRALEPLQNVAHECHCGVLLLDHHRKNDPKGMQDVINDVLGSRAKTAVADGIWGLYRKHRSTEGELLVTGRDIPERNLSLAIDWGTGLWSYMGEGAEETTPREQEILDFLVEKGAMKFAHIVADGGFNKGTVSKCLSGLVRKGYVVKNDKGLYVAGNDRATCAETSETLET